MVSIVTSYPGVYVFEEVSNSISIQASATAVPVFTYGEIKEDSDDSQSKVDDPKFDTVVKLNSWLDFLDLVGDFNSNDILHAGLRVYFENGGGSCYLIHIENLVREVPALDDVTLLVQAGTKLTDFSSAVSNLCQDGKQLFAIFDGPNINLSTEKFEPTDYPTTEYAATYYPNLKASWTELLIPPSAAIAGAYCQTDRTRGVWKAPANVSLTGGLTPVYKISTDVQGEYNKGKAINMILDLADKGATIMGARTLSDTNDWRYVPVRRLFNTVERDIKRALMALVFEPNIQAVWEQARASITSYLYKLWKDGGLSGSSEDEAFFVRVGLGSTMTEEDVLAGIMNVHVGIAASRPAEFIVVKFSQHIGTTS